MRVTLLCAVLLSPLFAGPAAADDATAARLHFERATRLADGRRREEALAAYLEAARLAPTARTLANIAILLGGLGRQEEEFLFWQEALRSEPPGDVQARADERIRALAGELATVKIATDPPGAEVFVGRQDLGRWAHTPCTIAVRPSPEVRVLVTRDGYESREETLELTAGEQRTLEIRLQPMTGTVVIRSR